ncbi:hypothetical protein JOJ87_005096 [Rhodococcus ruber]|uniref:hypothetical protein n=1 Tax=Rhodococcus ruber TaxID=1830 RepID=UPI001AEA9F6A|nr:hypothetical protein [Rhodococcus ruber]MBP2214684.1 hypothetical protein [Rhodococcus ruber]
MTDPILPTSESALPPPVSETDAPSTPPPLDTLDTSQTGTSESTESTEGWTAPVFLGVEWNGSALIAVLALIVAIASARYSRKNAKIAEAQEERRAARIEINVSRAVAWTSEDGKIMWVGARLTIEHPSDRDGSISRAELLIRYPHPDRQTTELRIPHETSSKGDSSKYIEIPRRLLANDSAAGWLTFPVPMEFYERGNPEIYIELRDPREFTAQREIGPLWEVENDPTK